MKFLELHLLAFGPFTDRILDFSQTNFHLIYGPNEAGKSTALRAVDGLMFGIPRRTDDGFFHDMRDLKIGASIVNADGRELSFARRKRDKKSLVTLDEVERVLAENTLDDFLKGMEQNRFNRLYCINHDEFRAGGNLMRELKGLAKESLVAASHGGGFSDVETELNSVANELWIANKPSARIRKLIKEYETAKRDKRELEIRVQEWKTLSDQRDQHLQRKKQISDAQAKLETEKSRLKRLYEALPLIVRWKTFSAQLADQKDVRILPDSYSADDRRDCAKELASTNQRIHALNEKLSALRDEITHARQSPDILRNCEEIDAIQQLIETQRQLAVDLSDAERNCEEAERQTRRWLDEIGVDVPLEEAGSFRIRAEITAAIQELNPREQSLREKPVAIANAITTKERELKLIDLQLHELTSLSDTRRLSEGIRAASRHLQVDQQIEESKDLLRRREKSVDRELSRLPGWSGSLDGLVRSKVPLRETIDQFAKEFFLLDGKIESLDEQLENRQEELARTREEIAASLRTTAVVTEDDLERVRKDRERGWQLVKKKIAQQEDATAVQAFAGGASLETAFEQRVRESDNVADRLRREAKRVGELAKQREKESGLALAVERLAVQLKKSRAARADLQRQWQSQWTASGIRDPRTPQEMGAWLDRHGELSQAAEEIAKETQLLRRLEQTHDSQSSQLMSIVHSFDSDFSSSSLQQIYAYAEELLAIHLNREHQREQLNDERSRLNDELSDLRPNLRKARQELEQWQLQWSDAMQCIGCEPNVTAAQALARVNCLRELTSTYEAWRRINEEIGSARVKMKQFELRVQSMTTSVAPDLQGLTAIEAATQLKVKLVEARSLDQAAKERNKQLEELKQNIFELQSEAGELSSRLAQFLALAGTDSLEVIDKIEASSLLASQRRQLESDLQQMSAGDGLESFVSQAEEADGDELNARISQLDEEIAELRTKRDEVVSKITEVETKMEEIDGSDAAAQADQRAMNCLAQIYEDAGRYLRLKIATCILRKQVERYRDENKDPLLAKASEYFADMTCNEFIGLQSDYDENGAPIIVGIRRAGEKLLTSAMSDGTLDPLFLSLRLAYLRDKLAQFEPMPLIVDDILIHLDDKRALATLKVLAEFSKLTQVLFFTHHQRLRELAEIHLTDASIHELERHNVQSLTSHPR